jgi:hypothetical protein
MPRHRTVEVHIPPQTHQRPPQSSTNRYTHGFAPHSSKPPPNIPFHTIHINAINCPRMPNCLRCMTFHGNAPSYYSMLTALPTRFAAAAVALTIATALSAQSTPPPRLAKPTATQPALPATAPTETYQPPPTPAQLPAARAQVTYAAGTLSITADNSSLNQILRQISQETGMKITGGVADERVFGQYGPATPAHVLNALLDGTASNMLFLEATGSTPPELILSARNGGATPPNPNAALHEQDDQREPPPPPQDEPAPTPEPQQPVNAPPAATIPAPGATSSDPSPSDPNGVKTPQQIFDQLQRMRQQQPQQQSTPQ